MAAYAETVTALMKRAVKVDQVTGIGMFMGRCDVTNYNSTLAEITDITGKFGTLMEVICSAISDNGYLMRWDKTGKAFKAHYPTSPLVAVTGTIKDDDNAATVGHALYVVPDPSPPVFELAAESSSSADINDSDTAASDGVLVYVVIDDVEFLPGFNLGHLEFVSPTNAHGTCTLKSGGATLLLEDDDAAATNGTLLKVQAAGAGMISAMAGTNRTLVPLSDGRYMDVEDGTGGSPVQVYFDEDGSNTYERLEAVIVDNADEPILLLETALNVHATPPSGFLARLVTVGPGATLSVGAVGNGGPTFQVLHDQGAAQMPGAAVLNAIAAGGGLDAAVGGEQDVFIPLSDGTFMKVTYAASPTGVQVYWDHDGANNYERMTEVVVDNADETFLTETTLGWKQAGAAAGEVANDVDVGIVEFVAYGLI